MQVITSLGKEHAFATIAEGEAAEAMVSQLSQADQPILTHPV